MNKQKISTKKNTHSEILTIRNSITQIECYFLLYLYTVPVHPFICYFYVYISSLYIPSILKQSIISFLPVPFYLTHSKKLINSIDRQKNFTSSTPHPCSILYCYCIPFQVNKSEGKYFYFARREIILF